MPENPKNKIRFGLKNVHYAMLTLSGSTPSYGAPVPIPGAVNLSLTKKSEDLQFYADDEVYVELGDNSEFDGELEIALIPDAFRTAALGETLDENGVLVENAVQEHKPFALLFEFMGDAKGRRHAVYNCTAGEDEVSAATKAGKIEVKTESLALHARQLPDGRVKTKTSDTTTAAVYDGWYAQVYLGSAPETTGNETTDGETTGG